MKSVAYLLEFKSKVIEIKWVVYAKNKMTDYLNI